MENGTPGEKLECPSRRRHFGPLRTRWPAGFGRSRPHRQNLGCQRRAKCGFRRPGRHRSAGRPLPTTAPAWWPATGWAKSVCGKRPTANWWRICRPIRRRWRCGVEAETGKVAAATKALEQAGGELTLAQAALDEQTKALGRPRCGTAAVAAAAQKAAADQAAAKALLDTKEAEEKAADEQLAKAKAAAAAGESAINAAVTRRSKARSWTRVVAEKGRSAKSVDRSDGRQGRRRADGRAASQVDGGHRRQDRRRADASPPRPRPIRSRRPMPGRRPGGTRSGHGRQSRLRRGPPANPPAAAK